MANKMAKSADSDLRLHSFVGKLEEKASSFSEIFSGLADTATIRIKLDKLAQRNPTRLLPVRRRVKGRCCLLYLKQLDVQLLIPWRGCRCVRISRARSFLLPAADI